MRTNVPLGDESSHDSHEMSEMTETNDFASPKSPKLSFDVARSDVRRTLQPPEFTLTEVFSNTSIEDEERQFSMRPRSMSHHLCAQEIPSRKWLKIRARWWRALMSLGMLFHDWAMPRPSQPNFKHTIRTDTIPIELYVYLPPTFHETLSRDSAYRFPAVINFHGGGFCLGDARDDRYWARVVLQNTNCIFISVNYRRAPEHPFPTPVDDCVDAIIYVAEHATELHIDQTNIALSGFSAGANLAFTAPLRLAHYHKMYSNTSRPMTSYSAATTSRPVTSYSAATIDTEANDDPYHESRQFVMPVYAATSLTDLLRHQTNAPLQIRSIVAWYPLLDWTMSRSRKIRESRNPQKCLSKTFTDLFDFSYLPAPDINNDHCSPYASPALAPDEMICNALPQDIQMWLCEWDMLLAEGQLFADRLERLGKRVDNKLIPRVPHGWDKSANPFRDQKAIDVLYTKAAMNLNKVFMDRDGMGPANSMTSLHISESIIQRQPRRSIILPL